MIEWIFLGFTIFYAGLISYFCWGWITLKTYTLTDKILSTAVTIIIPARNEEDHITGVVHACLSQEYPEALLEVIVIDDFSTDQTLDRLSGITDPKLKVLELAKHLPPEAAFQANKKAGIAMANEMARGKLIVTTDADCQMGKYWLAAIVTFYELNSYKMIAGPVVFDQADTAFKKFQALDFLSMIGIGAASISNHFPIMCNGANLAYEKEAFFEVGGFEGVDHIASGDDMLLLHKFFQRFPGKIGFLKNNRAIVSTFPVDTFDEFLDQRIRWTSKSFNYKNRLITAILGVAWLFHLSMLVNVCLGMMDYRFLYYFAAQFFVKCIVDLAFLYPLANFFQRKKLLWLFLPSQILHILYVISVGVLGNWGKYKWKGRLVR